MTADLSTPRSNGLSVPDSTSESPTPIESDLGFGNIRPLLFQLSEALNVLVADNVSSAIDLRSMPFSPGEESELKRVLGNGEVSALLKALGETELWETAYPGVWWVEHRNPEGERIAQSLEITWVPDILKSQPEDVQAARQRLNELLRISGENLHDKA